MSAHPHCRSRATHFTPREDLYFYRDRTVAVLRRYFRMALDLGRLPSLLGREFFRARVSSYKRSSFEDSVIFVHDVERSFESLDKISQLLLARIVLQNYSHEEAAVLLGTTRRTVARLYPEALDDLSSLLLERGILRSLPKHEPCQ